MARGVCFREDTNIWNKLFKHIHKDMKAQMANARLHKRIFAVCEKHNFEWKFDTAFCKSDVSWAGVWSHRNPLSCKDYDNVHNLLASTLQKRDWNQSGHASL